MPPHRSVSNWPGPGLQESTGLTADAMANVSPERVFTGQPRTRLHYEEDGQWIEGSCCFPLFDTGRQELAYDSQCWGPPVTGDTGPVMGDRDGQGLKHTLQKRD